MTTTRVGATTKYVRNWERAFGGKQATAPAGAKKARPARAKATKRKASKGR